MNLCSLTLSHKLTNTGFRQALGCRDEIDYLTLLAGASVFHPFSLPSILSLCANHLAIPDPGSMNTLTALELAYIKENNGEATRL